MVNRKVLKVFLLLGSLVAGQAYALGLGNITLNSHLNEPLEARIPLVSVGELSANALLVNLAPQEDFDKAMVERSYMLTGLVFQLDDSDSKNPAIIVTTAHPVREPSLNFIVELRSPSGRVLREYTLLLDIAQGGSRQSLRRGSAAVKPAQPMQAAAPSKPKEAQPEPQAVPPVVSTPTPEPALTPAAAPAPSATTADAAEAAAQAELAVQLTAAKQQANLTIVENETLKKQAADLEAQLADMTAQLNSQNIQMQAIKAELDAAAVKQASAPPTTTVAASEPVAAPAPAPVATPAPAVAKPAPVATPEPVVQQESEGSWGSVVITTVALLLVAAGLWFVRQRQQRQRGVSESVETPVVDEAKTPDSDADAVLAQFGAEHASAPQQEAVVPVSEERPLTTDEALDLLLADVDVGQSETFSAALQEPEEGLVEDLSVDELLMTDEVLPVEELEDWSVDALSTETTPVDKDFVFEPELFVETDVAAPMSEVEAPAMPADVKQQPETAVDEAFHDATDRDFVVTKLELARQYLEMSDTESARDLLQEVLEEGDDELKQTATDLLRKIS